MSVQSHDRFYASVKSVLFFLLIVLILKVTVGIVLTYGHYIPPDFSSDFLRERNQSFYGSYQWAFYAHIASGPIALVQGLLLINERFRARFPDWHRLLGRIQTVIVLGIVAPSGLWMSFYAHSGAVAGIAFAMLAIATGLSVAIGWRLAVMRRFREHRRWMQRSFLLLCSAILLRLLAGVATIADIEAEWTYPAAAWLSWLVPLAVFEFSIRVKQQLLHRNLFAASNRD